MILQKKCNFVLKNIISTLRILWNKNHRDGMICVRVWWSLMIFLGRVYTSHFEEPRGAAWT